MNPSVTVCREDKQLLERLAEAAGCRGGSVSAVVRVLAALAAEAGAARELAEWYRGDRPCEGRVSIGVYVNEAVAQIAEKVFGSRDVEALRELLAAGVALARLVAKTGPGPRRGDVEPGELAVEHGE